MGTCQPLACDLWFLDGPQPLHLTGSIITYDMQKDIFF